MAEHGTVSAVVQLADRVIGLCKFWIEAVRDAPSDLRSILLETSMLQTILSNLEFLVSCDDASSTVLSSLAKENGPIDCCHQVLKNLVKLVPDNSAYMDHGSLSTRDKMTTMATRLAWLFKQSEARKLLEELGRYKTVITLALTTDSIQDIKDIKTKTTQLFDISSDQQRNEIYRWFQQTDPSPIHNRAQKQIEEGTCSWMLRMPEWVDWLAATYRCLWIHGIPGAGKTVLASYLIEESKRHCDRVGESACATFYYYCYFGHNQDEAAPFLRWLITQLCRQSKTVSAYAYSLYEQGREPSLSDLLKALAAALSCFEAVYVILDAVDESNPRDDLLKIIRDLVSDPRFYTIQLLVTSREYLDIERVLEGISKPVSMSNPFVTSDIECYVQSALQENPKFKRWPQYLLDEVREELSNRAKGMFRWAVCQIHRLQRLPCEIRAIRSALATLPKTLDETYERTFLEISEDERFFVRQCLIWINFHSELYNNSIPCAVLLQALQVGDEEAGEPNDGPLFDEESLKEVCGCLITVSQGYGFNIYDYDSVLEAVPVISFAHYTVREFLDSERIATGTAVSFKLGEQVKLSTLRVVLSTALKFGNNNSSGLDDRINLDDGSHLCDDSDLCDYSDFGEPEHKRSVFEYLTAEFRSYCVATAFFSIAAYPEEIASQGNLRHMVFCLLDPSGGSTQLMIRFLNYCQHSFYLLSGNHGSLAEFNFWTLRWTAEPSSTTPRTKILLSLLLIVESFEGLAGALLECSEITPDWVHEPLQFRHELAVYDEEGVGGDFDIISVDFDGPMIEFFVQHNRDNRPYLRFFLDCGACLPNPNALLQTYVGFHKHSMVNECEGTCLLRRIIELGADPDCNAYTTTPLQIAVAQRDYNGADTLLGAGADPNQIGNPNGVRWCGTYRNYDDLEGLSPLFICQNEMGEFGSESEWQMLEALLVKYGARSFISTGMQDT